MAPSPAPIIVVSDYVCLIVHSCFVFDHLWFYLADEEISEVKDKNDSYAWLEEIEMPENSQMDGIEYLGPPITETAF